MRIGLGYDIHQLVEGRKLILGGIEIPHTKGLLGHSDADVVVHALIDAMLGALALGDIGGHFPDHDMQYKDIDSMLLLDRIAALVHEHGYKVGNIDLNIIAQKPKLTPYREKIIASLSSRLHINPADINVKFKTNETLDAVGEERAIEAQAVILLFKKP